MYYNELVNIVLELAMVFIEEGIGYMILTGHLLMASMVKFGAVINRIIILVLREGK